MTYDPNLDRRRSIRLKGYDYTQPGAYFITIVTFQREEIFGEVKDGKMICNELGEIAREEWFKTAQLRPNIRLYDDEFVIMPNHGHGTLWIVGDDNMNTVPAIVGAQRRCAPTYDINHADPKTNARVVLPGSLGAIVRAYKSAVTYRINALRNTRGVTVWQRNYYEHIIHNEAEYKAIWNYINANPLRWEDDQLHKSAPPNRFNRD